MIDFPRNGSFAFSGVIDIQELGVPLPDLTGWTGKSELRTQSRTLIANLNFAWVNAAERTYTLSVLDA